MYQKLFDQIVSEECSEPLRDVRMVPDLLRRIFHRIALVLDDDSQFIGSFEPEESDDE